MEMCFIVSRTQPLDKTLRMILDDSVAERWIEEMDGTVNDMVAVFLSFQELVLITQVELGRSRVQMVIINDAINRTT